MKKIAFTKRNLDGLEPSPRRYYIGDTKTPALAVAVQPSGVKTFYLYRRIGGQPKRVKIGTYPAVMPEQARDAAQRLNGEIASGGDPSKRRAEAKRFTLKAVWDSYRTLQLEAHSTERSRYEDTLRWDNHLKRWASRNIADIKTSDIAAWHGRQSATPVAANRHLQLLKRIFNHAVRHLGWEGRNPCIGIKLFPESSRDRFLNADELKRLFEALNATEELPEGRGIRYIVDRDVSDIIKFLLATGARKTNVLNLRWSDLDLGGKEPTWRLPASDSKNKQPITIHLPTSAVDILKKRTKREGVDRVWQRKDGKLPGIQNGWITIRQEAKLNGIRLHDLRRTNASWQLAQGASLSVIGKSLGHRSMDATATYARLDVSPIRRSVEAAASAMSAFDESNGKPLSLPAPPSTEADKDEN